MKQGVILKHTTPLKKNHEFKRLYNKGKSSASQYAVVYSRRNGRSDNRLGITVSTKLGGAVERNRIRRRLKEIYRLNEESLVTGYDIVLVARMKTRYAHYSEIESSLMSLFRNLKMFRNTESKTVNGAKIGEIHASPNAGMTTGAVTGACSGGNIK